MLPMTYEKGTNPREGIETTSLVLLRLGGRWLLLEKA